MTEDRSGGSETATVPDREGVGGAVVTPPPDELYRALASRTRRQVLYHLTAETRMSTSELLDVLAGEQATRKGEVVTPADRDTLRVALVHRDLPMLRDAEIVDYEGDIGHDEESVVELADVGAFVRETVRRAYEYDRAVGGIAGRA